MLASLSRSAGSVLLGLACASCGSLGIGNVLGSSAPQEGQPGFVRGFLGAVVADEPRAALIGREVLSQGGTAADAAVATGFMLSITLPSRAGLGGGGACLAYAADRKSPNGGVPEAVMFMPLAASSVGASADRPAAMPMLARGLYLLQARYGRRPFESLVVPSEEAARFGVPASRALTRDLGVVAGPLLADPGARSVFAPGGRSIIEGQTLIQPELAATLAQLRVSGVGDFYQGGLARRIADASALAGGPMTVVELRNALPKLLPALIVPDRNDRVAFLPPPADGGLAAAAAFGSLQHNPSDVPAAMARALAVAARWREGGVTPQALLTTASLSPASLPPLPASTSFATLDREGNAVVCAITMDNLFGTGRILPGFGFLLAASPASVPPPLLSAALAWNDNIHAFRAEVGGSGQEGAPIAVALGMYNALRSNQPMPAPVPEPGRANVIACSRYLPGAEGTCGWAADPREPGLATGGT